MIYDFRMTIDEWKNGVAAIMLRSMKISFGLVLGGINCIATLLRLML